MCISICTTTHKNRRGFLPAVFIHYFTSQTNSSSCVSDCTNQTIGSASPPSSPPNVSLSLREGVFTVVVCQEVKNTTYLIRVQDRFGNETYFPMVNVHIAYYTIETNFPTPFFSYASDILHPRHISAGVCML